MAAYLMAPAAELWPNTGLFKTKKLQKTLKHKTGAFLCLSYPLTLAPGLVLETHFCVFNLFVSPFKSAVVIHCIYTPIYLCGFLLKGLALKTEATLQRSPRIISPLIHPLLHECVLGDVLHSLPACVRIFMSERLQKHIVSWRTTH